MAAKSGRGVRERTKSVKKYVEKEGELDADQRRRSIKKAIMRLRAVALETSKTIRRRTRTGGN